jgi:hypothetical protein
MPNGNFFAFFPDYFGGFGHRKPYWEIDDIEILDGGIDLTDEFLATHVYIVGDTNFDFQVDWLDRLQSGGVMDLESAFRSGFITRPTEGEMTHQAALGFLKKYGARPYKEELPMIRSPFFEAFLAYQRFMQLWAKQFATKFQFTFMPELYPGGIVGLKDHGVQCYVEEVVHTFDYESGFTTEAILSAPRDGCHRRAGVGRHGPGLRHGHDARQRRQDRHARGEQEHPGLALMLSGHLPNRTQRVRITSVDPATRQMEGTLRDGAVIRITVWEVPASFTWPVVGEQWSVTRPAGMWILGHRIESVDDEHSIEDLAPGQGKMSANVVVDRTGRTFIAVDVSTFAHGESLVWDSVKQAFVPSSDLSPGP